MFFLTAITLRITETRRIPAAQRTTQMLEQSLKSRSSGRTQAGAPVVKKQDAVDKPVAHMGAQGTKSSRSVNSIEGAGSSAPDTKKEHRTTTMDASNSKPNSQSAHEGLYSF